MNFVNYEWRDVFLIKLFVCKICNMHLGKKSNILQDYNKLLEWLKNVITPLKPSS